MDEKALQLETGSFTRIISKVLDELVKVPLLGTEYRVALFIIRKTWGYGKKSDRISLSQFEEGTGLSRPTIVKAIKNLELVKVALLVRDKTQKGNSTLYSFNKYYNQWEVVNRHLLVKVPLRGGKGTFTKTGKGTLTHNRKIDNKQKKEEKQKAVAGAPTPSQTAKLFFKGVKDLMEKNSETKEATVTLAFIKNLVEVYPDATKEAVWREVKKFYLYWTELNSTGRKERWQTEKTFQFDRRLGNWLGKVKEFQGQKNYQSKGRGLVED